MSLVLNVEAYSIFHIFKLQLNRILVMSMTNIKKPFKLKASFTLK